MIEKTSYSIRDIAKEAEVSIATVSRFLNQKGYIDTETAKKIEAVIKRVGYRPSRNAQALKTRKSRQIVLIIPNICNPFYSTMAKIVQEYASQKGYTLTLYNTNEDITEEIKAIHTATEIYAEGIILSSNYVKEEVIQALGNSGLQVVVANSYEKCPFDSVHGHMGEGTYLTTKHLIELGHKGIAYIGGSKDSIISTSRRSGYRRAMQEASIENDDSYCFEMDFSEKSGYKAGKYLLTLIPRPTAICCANDVIALGLLAAFNENRIKVPEDISITGLDNIPYANLTRPSLTTVDIGSDYFSRRTIELLFERIESTYQGEPREIVLSEKLIVRESTCKIKS